MRPKRIEVEPVSATVMRGPREDGRWYWRARRAGTREVVWTGWATRTEASAVLGALVGKGLPPSRRSDRGAVRNVGELIDRWVEAQEQREAGGVIAAMTCKAYTLGARHWKSALDQMIPSMLTRTKIDDTLQAWRAEGMSPRTAALDHQHIAAILRWGAERGLCPVVDVSRLRSARVVADEYAIEDYTPTPAEVLQVIAECPDDDITRAIILQSRTGARIGEVAALRVADLVGDDLRLTGADEARGKRGKTGTRIFPLDANTAELVRAWSEGKTQTDALFPALWSQPANAVRWRLLHACETAKVPRFTSHAVRRMVAMRLLEVSDPATVAVLTGHSVQTLLRHYVRVRPEGRRSVVARAALAEVPKRGQVITLGAQKTGTGHGGKG